ncbi:hypothetical protein FDECE_13028 [Fusarium decemcellulare]|nr:hypothetical protein FDECE_13028 [Fusarium decemcellulare]
MTTTETIILVTGKAFYLTCYELASDNPPGANSGIGYETVFCLADAVVSNHVIMASRSVSRGTAALAKLKARKPAGTLSLIELDLTSDVSITAAARLLTGKFGKLDVLVNNAGICESYSLSETGRSTLDRETLRQVFETNTFGTMLLTQALEPLLRNSSDARIINVSSGLGSVALRANQADSSAEYLYDAYRMSKAALNMMSLSYSWHYRDWAKVWAYCPGFVVTNLTGEGDRELRMSAGAESGELAARGILDLVVGKRDQETGCFVRSDGKAWPW